MIESYFDGSADDMVLSLGGISASHEVWPRLNDKWAGALSAIGTDVWHTTDMYQQMTKREFGRATSLLFGVLGQFREALTHSYAASVILSDYGRARQEGVPLPSKPEAICVNWCFGQIVVPTAEDFPIVAYFDQNERFMHLVRRVWHYARRGDRQRRGWPWQVKDITSVEQVYPLQAADLTAWCARRYERAQRDEAMSEEDRQEAMELALHSFFAARHLPKVYDYQRLIELPEMYRRTLSRGER